MNLRSTAGACCPAAVLDHAPPVPSPRSRRYRASAGYAATSRASSPSSASRRDLAASSAPVGCRCRPRRRATWSREIPIGGIHPGEDPAAAAAREVEEETGWRPGPLRPLVFTQPTPGISDSQHTIFRADGATYTGPPVEAWESERVEWVPLSEVRGLIDKRDITSGTTLVALLYVLATE